jgi:hypothetical protein
MNTEPDPDVIYKYPLNLHERNTLLLPPAVPVHFEVQDGQLCLWVRQMTNPALVQAQRTFLIVGTGHPFPQRYLYLGTCQQGPFVWHLLEVTA